MNDVDDEADAARQSFSNKAPMSFIIFVIIDHQSWSIITKRTKLIGALLVVLN